MPISVVKETVITYDQNVDVNETNNTEITRLSEQYVRESMVAGVIVHANTAIVSEDDILHLSGVYTCKELIGKLKNEEIK